MNQIWILSAYTISPLFPCQKRGEEICLISLDLGLTQSAVSISDHGILLPDQTELSWENLQKIFRDKQSCYRVENGQIRKIEIFSEFTGRYYSLYPTSRAPTLLISGIPMHRIKGTDPYADTLAKIRAADPRGRVLDSATGLGYTAIEAAKHSDFVITIELDPAVLEICQLNPWSKGLFNNPGISQRIGDSFELIQEFPNDHFDRVIHDPPTFKLAGELYSREFYRQVYRVLKSHGRLFHYIGDLDSPSGKRTANGVKQRLIEAGFQRLRLHPEAFAIVAYKG